MNEADKKIILDSIRVVPDFPQPGVMFRDITTLLANANAFKLLINHLNKRYENFGIDYIAGIESRGFIFGAALAINLGVGFVPIRKKGKLPSTTISEKYSLEYGTAELEIHIDAFASFKAENAANKPRVLLIDDLIATGGTTSAAANLVKAAGGELAECCFIINLKELKGEEKVAKIAPIYSVLEL